MPLLNYTTKVEANKTVQQIMLILAEHGASNILTDWQDGRIVGLAFRVDIGNTPLGFRLPVDPQPVQVLLEQQWKRRKVARQYATPEQAENVAWRIVKSWVEAQMALLETGMVKIEEIFLPYLITGDGRTIYQVMVGTRFQLPSPRQEETKND